MWAKKPQTNQSQTRPRRSAYVKIMTEPAWKPTYRYVGNQSTKAHSQEGGSAAGPGGLGGSKGTSDAQDGAQIKSKSLKKVMFVHGAWCEFDVHLCSAEIWRSIACSSASGTNVDPFMPCEDREEHRAVLSGWLVWGRKICLTHCAIAHLLVPKCRSGIAGRCFVLRVVLLNTRVCADREEHRAVQQDGKTRGRKHGNQRPDAGDERLSRSRLLAAMLSFLLVFRPNTFQRFGSLPPHTHT